jgi:hypothetical protein
VMGFIQDRISWTICRGWPWTLILPISASQVARWIAWAIGAQLIFVHLTNSILVWKYEGEAWGLAQW